MLTDEQRKELEALGARYVGTKISTSGAGRGASIGGFKCGEMTRGEIEDWLVEKNSEESKLNRTVLFWERVAGVGAIIVIILIVIGILLRKYLSG